MKRKKNEIFLRWYMVNLFLSDRGVFSPMIMIFVDHSVGLFSLVKIFFISGHFRSFNFVCGVSMRVFLNFFNPWHFSRFMWIVVLSSTSFSKRTFLKIWATKSGPARSESARMNEKCSADVRKSSLVVRMLRC